MNISLRDRLARPVVLIYWAMLAIGLGLYTKLVGGDAVTTLWIGSIAGTVLGHCMSLRDLRLWIALVTVFAIAYVGALATPHASHATTFWMSFVPAVVCGYVSLADRWSLAACWYPAVLWMLTVLDRTHGTNTVDGAGAVMLGGFAVMVAVFLRARETRRVGLWKSVGAAPLAAGKSTKVLKEAPGRQLARTSWAFTVTALTFAITAWIAPRLWEVQTIESKRLTTKSIQLAGGLPCCPVNPEEHVRVKEYLDLGRGKDADLPHTEGVDCQVCPTDDDSRYEALEGSLVSTYDPRWELQWRWIDGRWVTGRWVDGRWVTVSSVGEGGGYAGGGGGYAGNGGGGGGAGGYGNGGGGGYASNDYGYHNAPSYTPPSTYDYTPPTYTPPTPTPTPTPRPTYTPPTPTPTPTYTPPPAPTPTYTPPPPAPTPAPAAAPHAAPSPRPAANQHMAPASKDEGSSSLVKWLLTFVTAALVFQMVSMSLRPLRRALTLRHLRNPFWDETIDQRVSNAWQLALVGLRDAGYRFGSDESPREFAARVGVAELETCATILERARYGIAIDDGDLSTMTATADRVYHSARAKAGAFARASSWVRWPLA